MKDHQHALFQTNSRALKQGFCANERPRWKIALAPKKPFKLNVHACTRDAYPDWLKTEHKQHGKMKNKELVYLPILVHKKGVSLEYAWDGQCLLLEKDLKIHEAKSLKQLLKDFVRRARLLILSLFVPEQVQSNYMDYLKWKFVHRIFSSAIQVQATQSAIHRSFAVADNLGDVAAKSQIQTVCFDNIGLALAACMNLFCKSNPRIEAALPFVMYPFFTAMDLFAIYQGLKYVHLPTLNKARIEIIVDKWIHSRTVPSTAEVSNVEGMQIFHPSGSSAWPLRIGFINAKEHRAENMVSVLQSLRNEDRYFICTESCYGFLWKPQLRLLLCLHEKATAADTVMGLLQASYMRFVLTSKENIKSMFCNGHATLKPETGLHRNWKNLLEESKRFARDETFPLLDEMKKSGWVIKNVFLSPSEQVTYSMPGEKKNHK